jgi:hypothetical protein
MCIAWKGRVFAFQSLPMGVSPSAAALQTAVDKYFSNWIFEREGVARQVVTYMDDLTIVLWVRCMNKWGHLNLDDF